MTTASNRVATPCGAGATARDVLEGIALTGKRMIVTGAPSGGRVETARAQAGAAPRYRTGEPG